MTDTAIKPFKIISTRAESEGTGVFYEVSHREVNETSQITKTLGGYMLVPPGKDLDKALFEHLQGTGWI